MNLSVLGRIGTGINDGTTTPRQSIHSIHENSGSDNIEHGPDNSATEAARDSYLHESSTGRAIYRHIYIHIAVM